MSEPDRASPTRRNPLMLVPPPLWFVGTFVLAWLVLDRRVRALPLVPARLERAADVASMALIAAGALLFLSCFALFVQRRTTIMPPGHPSSLVVRGPYTFTRNPMYVAMTLLYLGATLAIGTAWALVLLPLPLLILNAVVIPFEERRLSQTFGDDYRRYTERVRRWI